MVCLYIPHMFLEYLKINTFYHCQRANHIAYRLVYVSLSVY